MEPVTTASGLSALYSAFRISGIALGALNNSGKIKRALKVFLPAIKVAVYGESGSGKSSFLSALSGSGFSGETTRDIEYVKYRLPDGRRVVFYDCPGQKSYSFVRRLVKKDIINRKFDGIINVVCYGYNESSATNINMFETGTENKVKESYLEQNRRLEIEQLNEWAEDITSDTGIKWIITLINKADVWTKEAEAVSRHYGEGDYAGYFQGLSKMNCYHHLVPYCSAMERFGGKPMTMNIDQSDKEKMHMNFVSLLVRCLKRH